LGVLTGREMDPDLLGRTPTHSPDSPARDYGSEAARLDWRRPGKACAYRQNARPTRAISGPLTPVNSGQSRSWPDNEPPSSAALTAVCNTPSKLAMRVRFPSSALAFSGCSAAFPSARMEPLGVARGPASLGCAPALSRAPVYLQRLTTAAPYAVCPLNGVEAAALDGLPKGGQR
jgi:hypothetical protein